MIKATLTQPWEFNSYLIWRVNIKSLHSNDPSLCFFFKKEACSLLYLLGVGWKLVAVESLSTVAAKQKELDS